MKTISRFAAVLGIAVMLAVGVGGCGSNPFSSDSANSIPSGNIPNGNGTIQSINRVGGTDDSFRFAIRMNNGQIQTLRHDSRAGFRVGDEVRIRGGMMEKM